MQLPLQHRQVAGAGFTLVELAIVLAIIGLLAGGIVAGQSLVRAAAIRSIPTQAQKFINATQLFINDYGALPGDLTTATSYWGTADPTPATCAITATRDFTTCNGNGDGVLGVTTGSIEFFRYWQQLAAAGLIDGNYDGVTHGSSNNSVTKDNGPVGKLSNTGWFAYNWATQAGNGTLYAGVYNNYLLYGTITANSYPSIATLTPEEAYSIDLKIDDGLPGTGTVVVFYRTACTLSSGVSDYASGYALTTKTISCNLVWPNALKAN